MLRNTLIAFVCLALIGCQKEDINLEGNTPNISQGYANVDEELWSFFASFELEAAKRDVQYDLNALQIEGAILELHQGNVAGICSYSSNQPNLVEIDASFWSEANHLLKEMIVFHELGHCVIGRNHFEAQDAQGNCKSIMRSGVQDCRDNYQTLNRKDYLDELFLNKVNLFNI